ncbi:MAG TPA: hypothetical protein VEL47_03195 [Myxococcota bacterium]|nr:hypothetical protein [Myxococcota bacterium]
MKKYLLTMLFAVIFLGGSSCFDKVANQNRTKSVPTPLALDRDFFVVDPDSLWERAPEFAYKSEMTLSIGEGERQKDNSEEIEVRAGGSGLLLSKKIDQFHFLQIFKDGDDFLIKHLNGPFKKASDNHDMYSKLLREGMNLTSWVVEQFGLSELSEKPAQVFAIKDGRCNSAAPFLQMMAKKHSQFRKIENSTVQAKVVFDDQTRLPKSAHFDIFVLGTEQHWLRLRATMVTDVVSKSLLTKRPILATHSPIDVPVNVARRFKELVNK